ncbi:CelD/BcsL family acetyltransferase involved in cellulose biosynthesis [Actinocorallia herbida]|uniref:CelD/BcsL family acetyltransferase involved in cellulose biosynthesis n=1 Tax=Actinocorallia herbida TaxID=58109 RepID=A0A3N1CN48_9ACTN|nr:GNAT family N-acetyltransferase [Actinocorallia herbida]ROO82746.1 CelD/BcsL family acetyltransferase involved in cellulose biosynthesis [Actinocorallia herbida]
MTPRTRERKPFDALSTAELAAWTALRAADPLRDSPYFHPEFAAAVHRSGTPVHVVVERAGAEVTALLALQITGSVARPVGWPGADFQGPIGAGLSPRTLLTGGVRTFEFDHLVQGSVEFEPYIQSRRVSPFLDVTGGLDGYLGRASRSGRDNMGQARRRLRQAEREGPVRFTADDPDPAALDELIDQKRGQYRATGARDYFADPRHRDLAHALLKTRHADFGGVLSTLRAGDRLLAAHFGLRSGPVLHWWFPVYDPAFSRLAPGWMLLRELVSDAPALGVGRIDLGRGEDEYKRRAKTGETEVCQGLASRDPLRLARRRALDALRRSPFAPGLRRLARKVR